GDLGVICCVFFFQAEDGIRDKLVTGVQTCALPISKTSLPRPVMASTRFALLAPPMVPPPTVFQVVPSQRAMRLARIFPAAVKSRSEERRVGKECRGGGSQCGEKKKQEEDKDRRKCL